MKLCAFISSNALELKSPLLVAAFLHSCLPPVSRSLFASQQAGTASHLLCLVDEHAVVLEAYPDIGTVILLIWLSAASHRATGP